MKKLIIVVGPYGVGKTYFSEKYIKEHPEFVLCEAGQPIDDMVKHEYAITDYYFIDDYNAEKLRSASGADVEIFVLVDSPLEIAHRQILHKGNLPLGRKDIWNVCNIYINELHNLIDIGKCRFFKVNGEEISKETYEKIICTEQPSKEWIETFLDNSKNISGYDYRYHAISLPYGLVSGDPTYSQNETTWAILKDLYSWSGKRVADFCCFAGYFSQKIMESGGIPSGFDINKNAIWHAAVYSFVNGLEIPLYNLDICSDWPKTNFDAALLLNCFHHLKNKTFVINNLKKYNTVFFEVNQENVPDIMNNFNVVLMTKTKRGRMLIKTEKGN